MNTSVDDQAPAVAELELIQLNRENFISQMTMYWNLLTQQRHTLSMCFLKCVRLNGRQFKFNNI